MNMKRLFLLWSVSVAVAVSAYFWGSINSDFESSNHHFSSNREFEHKSWLQNCIKEELGDRYWKVSSQCQESLKNETFCVSIFCSPLIESPIQHSQAVTHCMRTQTPGCNYQAAKKVSEPPSESQYRLNQVSEFLTSSYANQLWIALASMIAGIGLFPAALFLKKWLYTNQKD